MAFWQGVSLGFLGTLGSFTTVVTVKVITIVPLTNTQFSSLHPLHPVAVSVVWSLVSTSPPSNVAVVFPWSLRPPFAKWVTLCDLPLKRTGGTGTTGRFVGASSEACRWAERPAAMASLLPRRARWTARLP